MIVDVDLLDQTIHKDSACDSTMLKAVLKLQYTPKEEKAPYFLSFIFDGVSGLCVVCCWYCYCARSTCAITHDLL